MKSNESEKWTLYIFEPDGKNLLTVTDNTILYENRKSFKITISKEVYMSTPQYIVEVYKNDKLIDRYYLLNLNQIEFGTIEVIT